MINFNDLKLLKKKFFSKKRKYFNDFKLSKKKNFFQKTQIF